MHEEIVNKILASQSGILLLLEFAGDSSKVAWGPKLIGSRDKTLYFRFEAAVAGPASFTKPSLFGAGC